MAVSRTAPPRTGRVRPGLAVRRCHRGVARRRRHGGGRQPLERWRPGGAVTESSTVQPDPTSAPVGRGAGAPEPMTAVARAFELAAAHAAAQPFTPPRPDQSISSNCGSSSRRRRRPDEGPSRRKDGPGLETGRRPVQDGVHAERISAVSNSGRPAMSPRDYPTLAGLPADPQAMLAWLRSKLGPVRALHCSASSRPSSARTCSRPTSRRRSFGRRLSCPASPSRPSRPPSTGDPVTALGRVLDGWRQFDILLDSDAQSVIGSRNIAIADYQDPGGHFAFKQGAVHGHGAAEDSDHRRRAGPAS